MILAAGMGARLQPLTLTTPKPLVEVGHKPLIVHLIEKLAASNITELVINTSHLAEQIEQYLGDGSRYGVNIVYSREHQPLETAGGIRKALPLLGNQPFLVVNGDVWCDIPFAELKLSPPALAHLVLVPNPHYRTDRGDFNVDEHGNITESFGPYTFSGVSVINPSLLSDYLLEEDRLGVLIQKLIGKIDLTASIHDGEWVDIGTVERLNGLREKLAADYKGSS